MLRATWQVLRHGTSEGECYSYVFVFNIGTHHVAKSTAPVLVIDCGGLRVL